MAAAVAGSRITGLLRIVVAAAILGSTVLGDLFVAINVLPLMLYDVFAGSAISSVLVPPLVKLIGRGDHVLSGGVAARRFSANALGLIMAAMAAVAAVALLARPAIAGALTAGVEPRLASDAVSVGALLLALIVPQLVLYAAIGVFVSIQQAHRQFLLPSAAPIIENLGLLATIAVAWMRYGGGIEVDSAPLGLILTLGIGSGLSVSAHAIVQFVGARRAIGAIGIGFDVRDPDIVELGGPTKASFGWSSIIAARQFALVVAAGFAGAGGVQAFEIATLAYFIPVALIGRPIASAALPRLAAANSGPAAVLSGYLTTVRLAAWVAVPAGAALVFLSGPLADVIGQGEFAGAEANAMLRYGLAGLGIGAASDAIFEIARQATMAYGDGRGLVRSTWIRAGVAVAGIPFVVLVLDGPPVLLGLGIVVSLGDVVALAVAHLALRSGPAWTTDRTTHWPRILVASVVATAPVALIGSQSDTPWGPIGFVGLSAAVLVLFLLGAWFSTQRGQLLKELAGALQSEDLA
jgi:peptidoglycan biosynthesis protein MviN/MurJ (putative lipid II flippase)